MKRIPSTFSSRTQYVTSRNHIVHIAIGILFFALGYRFSSLFFGGNHEPRFKSPPPRDPIMEDKIDDKAFFLSDSLSTFVAPMIQKEETQIEREKIKLFVGIFTVPAEQHSEYGQRRAAIRQTWLPLLQELPGVRAQWVVGQSTNRTLNVAMRREARSQPSSFLFLSALECYECLPEKSKEFFVRIYELYDADWILKIDDDVYLAPTRLPILIQQWTDLGVDYGGCMKRGDVIRRKPSKWAEPSWPLLAEQYSLHAYGSAYGLSRRAASIVSRNAATFRRMSSEDVNMGMWMLAFNITFFPDARMCTQSCHPDGVAFSHTYYNYCGGLCHPVHDLFAFHRQFMCRSLRTSLRFIHGKANGEVMQRLLNTSITPDGLSPASTLHFSDDEQYQYQYR